jgi:hypothetical protein
VVPRSIPTIGDMGNPRSAELLAALVWMLLARELVLLAAL